jgi:SAM-dependent methyltransferase
MIDNGHGFTIVFATFILFLSVVTLCTFDTWQTVLFASLCMLIAIYVLLLGVDKLTTLDVTTVKEGFISESHQSKYEWLQNDELFDDFYASVFMKLTQIETLIQAESAICLQEFETTNKKEHMNILDAGCGVGIATCAFKKLGVKSVVGLDKSRAMIQYARNTVLPNTTLTDTEKQDIEFRNMDLLGPTSANAAEFTDACILYFTIYYFRDLDTLFRNLALWVKPGGNLAIEVVNKYKFDPVLNPSNPWVGVSPQKYAKERLHKSTIVFDKFDYESVFELEDPRAEFRETFRYKDGSVRRQKHTLYMRSIPDIVKIAKESGWLYTKYVDLMPLSFQYGYILFFKRAE